jgi:iron complex outermembrane recepter protein
LNPFTTGRAASDPVLRSIWSDAIRDSKGTKDQLSGFIRGELVKLPIGPVEAIAGVEFSRDVYETSIPGLVTVVNGRRARAAYW